MISKLKLVNEMCENKPNIVKLLNVPSKTGERVVKNETCLIRWLNSTAPLCPNS